MTVHKEKHKLNPTYYFYIKSIDEVFNISKYSTGATDREYFDEFFITRTDEFEITKSSFKEVPKEFLPRVIRYIFESWKEGY